MTAEGLKFDNEKIMLELIAPEMMLGIGTVLTYGAKKYAAENWRNGIQYKRVYGGVMRHMLAWFNGEDDDPETGLSHLWHASCGMMFLITYTMHDYGKFDDRPNMGTSPEKLKERLKECLSKI